MLLYYFLRYILCNNKIFEHYIYLIFYLQLKIKQISHLYINFKNNKNIIQSTYELKFFQIMKFFYKFFDQNKLSTIILLYLFLKVN